MTPLPDNADKATTAQWMGYGQDIAEMDRCHDWWHKALAKWLGLPSFSMRVAAGEDLSHDERVLAGLEEDAVLMLQRYVQHRRVADAFERAKQVQLDARALQRAEFERIPQPLAQRDLAD